MCDRVEIHDGSPKLWAHVGDQIVEIEQSAFDNPAERLSRDVLATDISDPTTMLALLWRGDAIIGFMYLEVPSRLDPERAHDDVDTRHISDAAIRCEHQGAGLVGLLMLAIENKLRERAIRYVTRNVKISNRYADAVERHYRGRIVETHDHVTRWGHQRWFKITV